MKKFANFTTSFSELFATPISNWQQGGIIFIIALSFIFFPQSPPSDWVLNTAGLWEDGLSIYKSNPNAVYPPWGSILLLPYYLLTAAGSRIASVMVIAWLCQRRRWSMMLFGAIILNPYFIYTMTKSNADILVLVLPILLWEASEGKRLQGLGQGLALSFLLLKPQGAILLIPYLLWQKREQWRELILPLSIVALITLPISLLGQPPLILQWLDNITNPSLQNQIWWAVNNLSLTAKINWLPTIALFLVIAYFLRSLVQARRINWTNNHTLASLLALSMFLSPYTSNQAYSAALAFIPSWPLVGVEIIASFLPVAYFYSIDDIWILHGNSIWFAIPLFLIAIYFHNRHNKTAQPVIHP